ncbi:DctP family TRAP transporter solute-binding subunit [Clostridium sp. MCC353]|uniref:TRAP transporter substrate-binding protein n=1 Tax=Clostridium sp. MCC353 TaxID=2592646 RepID=UPI001C0201B7|nr:TRAP transporter substrate-binding protein [Clostridium sp. MCC353]MBT9777934.1 DctP family TRAP transporter solute-binding subunit [Clostridium sp. MCC353]
MKNTLKVLSVTIIAAALCACSGETRQPEKTDEPVSLKTSNAGETGITEYTGKEYKFQLGHHMQSEHSTNKYAEYFVEELERLSGGKITAVIYPAGQLGNQAENTEAVRMGTLEMTISDLPSIAALYTPADIIGLPYLFKDMEHVERFYDSGRFGTFKGEVADATGIRILSDSHSGMRMVYSQNPISSVADMKNLKIRVPEIPVYVNTFAALGCSTTPIPFSEIYTSLQTGVVDALELPPEGFYTASLYEVTKSMAVTNHIYCDMALLINNDLFNSLEPEAQAIVEEAAQEAALKHRRLVKDQTEELISQIKDKGLTVTEPPFEEFQQATAKVWEDFIAKNPEGQELIDSVKSLEE